jgi:hypothetical protein
MLIFNYFLENHHLQEQFGFPFVPSFILGFFIINYYSIKINNKNVHLKLIILRTFIGLFFISLFFSIIRFTNIHLVYKMIIGGSSTFWIFIFAPYFFNLFNI